MTVKESRPRGRLLALAGLALLAFAAAPAAHAATTVTSFDPGIDVEPLGETAVHPAYLTAGADGAMWLAGTSLASSDGSFDRTQIARVDAAGRRSTFTPGTLGLPDQTGLVPLADGSIGYVGATVYALTPAGGKPAFVRLRAGTAPRVRRLPAVAANADQLAIAPDGSVWFARSCADALGRITPSGRVIRMRLPRLGCSHVDEWVNPQNGGAIRFGQDGSTWLANLCQGRIVRIDWRGRMQSWRRAPACTEESGTLQVLPSVVQVDAAGGLSFAGGRVTPAGKVTSIPGTAVPDAVTADGTAWQVTAFADHVIQRSPHAASRTVAMGGPVWAAVAGGDGELWTLGGPVQTIAGTVFDRYTAAVTPVTASGSVGSAVPISSADGAFADMFRTPEVSAGPDGGVWVAGTSYAVPGKAVQRIAHVTPSEPLKSVLRGSVVRVLGRDGRTVSVQLRCAGPVARFCTGHAALAPRSGRRRLARRAVPFSIEGGTGQTVVFDLNAATIRSLRRHDLHATVRLTTAAATTRTNVTVPR